jgi:MoxR-like ATPase
MVSVNFWTLARRPARPRIAPGARARAEGRASFERSPYERGLGMGETTGIGRAGLLERSEHLKVLREDLAAAASSGQGRIVLVAGEAGIAKTALLRRFCADLDGSARVLWARCEPLFTPRGASSGSAPAARPARERQSWA